jgi:hypothetical protein
MLWFLVRWRRHDGVHVEEDARKSARKGTAPVTMLFFLNGAKE